MVTNLKAPLVAGADPIPQRIGVISNLAVDRLTFLRKLRDLLVLDEERVDQLVMKLTCPVHGLLHAESPFGNDGRDEIVLLLPRYALPIVTV